MGSPRRPSGDRERRSAELRIAPDFNTLESVRRFIASELLDGRNEHDALYLVAANEVVTNAIESHRRAGIDDSILVMVDPINGTVVVADRGDGYQPEEHPERSHLGASGRGLLIAAAVAPDLSWEPNSPRGTVFTLPYPGPTAHR